jgi:hypothetical protein
MTARSRRLIGYMWGPATSPSNYTVTATLKDWHLRLSGQPEIYALLSQHWFSCD